MSLVGRWEETKFPAGINLVQTMAPGWRQIESEVALDLITIPAVSALPQPCLSSRSFDIIASIENLRSRGMEFLNIPDSYYNVLRKRLAKSPVKVDGQQ